MDTPIVDFVREYAERDCLRLHMPGHKGNGILGVERYDITEIDGAGVLYSHEGIIRQSEENAAVLFGAAKTLYSTEGSSLAIRAMLYLVKLYGGAQGARPLIAAGRNAHKTFMTACALLDFEIDWLMPKNAQSLLSCDITPESLENYLAATEHKPQAVYVTSPDYLGNMLDIAALSAVCRRHGVLLLVDNAHGAYLKFLPESLHPMTLGADMCCDSAHKTLPVLTGGAYLHISHNAPQFFSQQAETAMSVFASTSPSYLILQSLDMANKYIASGFPERLSEFSRQLCELKKLLIASGYTVMGDEPLKITIATKGYGYSGFDFARMLAEKGIVCEFYDPDVVVMMLTVENSSGGIEYLKKVLLEIPRKNAILEVPPVIKSAKRALSVKKAMMSASLELETEVCEGRVLAQSGISCPPAVPILVCGEVIDRNAIECLKYYGIEKCRVVI